MKYHFTARAIVLGCLLNADNFWETTPAPDTEMQDYRIRESGRKRPRKRPRIPVPAKLPAKPTFIPAGLPGPGWPSRLESLALSEPRKCGSVRIRADPCGSVRTGPLDAGLEVDLFVKEDTPHLPRVSCNGLQEVKRPETWKLVREVERKK